jgi:outer membrane protein
MRQSTLLPRRAPWLLCALALALLLAAAAERPTPRVAVVDAERIRRESTSVRGKLTEISRPAEQVKQQLLAKQKELQTAMNAYQAQKSAMSDAAKEQKSKEINRLREETNALGESFNEALGKAGGQDLELVRRQIMDVVTGLAAERNLDVVFSTANVLYNAPSAELTDEVIRRLDAAGH